MQINKENLELSYEVEKLKAKLNLSYDIIKAIDEELLMLRTLEITDFNSISETINKARDGLRDLADFMKEK